MSTTHEAPKIFREDCRIDWTLPVSKIDFFIRGLSPYPAAWSTLIHKENKKELSVKIHFMKIINEDKSNFSRIYSSDNKILVQTLNGLIEITQLQVEGKKRLDGKSLLNGFNIDDYELV